MEKARASALRLHWRHEEFRASDQLELSYLPEDCNLRARTEQDLRKLLKGLPICYWRFPRRGRQLYPESASYVNL